MKKIILITFLIASISATATYAYGPGDWKKDESKDGPPPHRGPDLENFSQLDEDTQNHVRMRMMHHVAKMSPEMRDELQATLDVVNSMSEEERQALLTEFEEMREQRKAEKQARRDEMKKNFESMTDEQKANMKEYWKSMSHEERRAQKETLRNMTEEERKAWRDSVINS